MASGVAVMASSCAVVPGCGGLGGFRCQRARTTLSAEVNSALRAEFTRRRRQQALADLLDRLADERGQLDTPEDEAEIARYGRLLGGRAEGPEELRAG